MDERALTRAIALIVSTLSDKALLDQCLHEELRGNLALHLLDSFVVFLRGKSTSNLFSIFLIRLRTDAS